MKKRLKKAFTLVELLVVIAILAVLSSVAIVGYNSFTEKAKDSKAVENARIAYDYYYMDSISNDSKVEDLIYEESDERYVAINDGKFDAKVHSSIEEAMKVVKDNPATSVNEALNYRLSPTVVENLYEVVEATNLHNFTSRNVNVSLSKVLDAGTESITYNIMQGTFNVATIVVPADAILDTALPVEVTFTSVDPSTIITLASGEVAFGYDITVSNLKTNLSGDNLVYVELEAPSNLSEIKAYHNTTLIDDAKYDKYKGLVSFETSSFSPYILSYAQEGNHNTTAKFDGINHWVECDCGYISNVKQHTLINHHSETEHWQECSGCEYVSAKENYNIVYDHDEIEHWGKCNICNEDVKREGHDIKVVSDETHHWNHCECGYDSDKVTHTYNQEKNNEEHWDECECGHKKDIVSHELVTKHENNEHWKECACGYATAKEAYTIVDGYDEEGHFGKCSVCGSELTRAVHTHEPTYNETYHWKECDCGHKIEEAKHNLELTNDETHHWYYCDGCDYTTEKVKHTSNNTKQSDETDHWENCSVCNEVMNKETHNHIEQVDGTHRWEECICGDIINETNIVTLYFVAPNDAYWGDNSYCYVWNSETNVNNTWPGEKMDYEGYNSDGYRVYSIEVDTLVYDMVKFTNKESDNWKTNDTELLDQDNTQYFLGNGGNDVSISQVDYENVYFSNNWKWSTVKCYTWKNSSSSTNNGWPGKTMDYVKTNSYDEDQYKILVDLNKYDYIIFNNGSKQSVNQSLSDIKNSNAFYISGENGDKVTLGKFNFE